MLDIRCTLVLLQYHYISHHQDMNLLIPDLLEHSLHLLDRL